MTDNIVQVVHTRYTDEGCNIEVFLNGRKVEATIEDVDPGRGYGKREWARRVKQAEQEAIDFPTEFTAAVAEALASNADSKYLDEDDDEDDDTEDEHTVYGACGVPDYTRCRPLFDANDNPIPGTD
jgi:hypothetical protein